MQARDAAHLVPMFDTEMSVRRFTPENNIRTGSKSVRVHKGILEHWSNTNPGTKRQPKDGKNGKHSVFHCVIQAWLAAMSAGNKHHRGSATPGCVGNVVPAGSVAGAGVVVGAVAGGGTGLVPSTSHRSNA